MEFVPDLCVPASQSGARSGSPNNWAPACMEAATRDSLLSMFAQEALPLKLLLRQDPIASAGIDHSASTARCRWIPWRERDVPWWTTCSLRTPLPVRRRGGLLGDGEMRHNQRSLRATL